MATKAAHVLAVPATRVLAAQRKLRDVRTAVKQLQDARLTAPEEITTAVKSLARVAGDRSLPPDLRDSARKSVEALTGAVLTCPTRSSKRCLPTSCGASAPTPTSRSAGPSS